MSLAVAGLIVVEVPDAAGFSHNVDALTACKEGVALAGNVAVSAVNITESIPFEHANRTRDNIAVSSVDMPFEIHVFEHTSSQVVDAINACDSDAVQAKIRAALNFFNLDDLCFLTTLKAQVIPRSQRDPHQKWPANCTGEGCADNSTEDPLVAEANAAEDSAANGTDTRSADVNATDNTTPADPGVGFLPPPAADDLVNLNDGNVNVIRDWPYHLHGVQEVRRLVATNSDLETTSDVSETSYADVKGNMRFLVSSPEDIVMNSDAQHIFTQELATAAGVSSEDISALFDSGASTEATASLLSPKRGLHMGSVNVAYSIYVPAGTNAISIKSSVDRANQTAMAQRIGKALQQVGLNSEMQITDLHAEVHPVTVLGQLPPAVMPNTNVAALEALKAASAMEAAQSGAGVVRSPSAAAIAILVAVGGALQELRM